MLKHELQRWAAKPSSLTKWIFAIEEVPLVEPNIEAVRSRALGFKEFDFFGLGNSDGEQTVVELTFPSGANTR